MSLTLAVGLASPSMGIAAGGTLVPADKNSHITVLDAHAGPGGTRVLYLTYPGSGDPTMGQPCQVNVYAAMLQPGLKSVQAEAVAPGLCHVLGTSGVLLPDGSAQIVTGGRMERWHDGERKASLAFAQLAATQALKVNATQSGQHIRIAPNGDSLVVVPFQSAGRPRSADRGVDVAALDPAGQARWTLRLHVPGEQTTVLGAWAGANGGALLYAETLPTEATSPAIERRLYSISSAGELREPVLIGEDKQLDMARLANLTPEEQGRIGELLKDSYMEGIRRLNVEARRGGGYDVLLDRSSGPEEREGQFLYRIGKDGRAESVLNLTDRIEAHGLDRWADFRIEGEHLVLLGEVTASQPGVQARRDTWPQIAVSRIPLAGGPPLTRVVPLDQRYLAAVMNAGDEQLQHVKDRPGGQPVLLSRLGGKPLAIAIGFLQGRFALRFDEAGDELVAWDEVYEKQQAKRGREAARQQRKADRVARQQQMSTDMAAAVGMTPEEYAALSNRERKEAMLRSGDMDAMMAVAQEQAAMAMQQMAEAQGDGSAAAMDPQMAAAMQQAMAAMAGAQSGAQPARGSAANETLPGDVLKVDAGQRGFVDYEHPDGAPVTLLISDRATEKELLSKTYDDGVIYEHVDFGRFGLPLQQISIEYLDASGNTLAEVTPAIAR